MTTGEQAQSIRDAFSQNLRRIRAKQKLSQEELARLIAMHPTEISALERGGREPRLQTLIRLSAALEASPEEFVAGIEWRPLRSPPTAKRTGRFHITPPKNKL